MSTGERGMQIKSDDNKETWEGGDFPSVCETCLGDNPYVRMTKEPHGKACKICEKPFTIFRWKPGAKARFKATQICMTCAKMKNVCQVCIFDLQYGLPVEVRDKFLGEEHAIVIPQSEANQSWFSQQQNQLIANGGSTYDKAPVNPTLLRLARTQPYYKRNLPHKCSFYAKGECHRGKKCPFLHEMPTDKNDPLAKQNYKDRFYGTEDPVAQKMLTRAEKMPQIEPPNDPSITSLWLGNLSPTATQDDIKDIFYAYGELKSIKIIVDKKCAFVEYTTREAAESAASTLYNNCYIKGGKCKLTWATKSKQDLEKQGQPVTTTTISNDNNNNSIYSMPPPPGWTGGALPKRPPGLLGFTPKPGTGSIPPPRPPPLPYMQQPAPTYPSMNPTRMGAHLDSQTFQKKK